MLGGVEQHYPALIGVTLARRSQPCVHQCGHAVGHRGEQPPAVLADREPGGRRLDGGEGAKLEDEAVVVRGEFAVDARRERVVAQRLLKQCRGPAPPPGAFCEPGERAGGGELTRGLGDQVIVGRRPRLSKAARYRWCQRI